MWIPEIENRYRLFGMIFLLSNRLQVIGNDFFEDVTAKQWFLLAALAEMETPPNLKELSEAIGCSHQNTRQLMKTLEEKGYIELIPDETDKRSFRIRPTHKHKAFEQRYEQKSELFLDALYKGLDHRDLDQAFTFCQALLQNLENTPRFERMNGHE